MDNNDNDEVGDDKTGRDKREEKEER